MNDSWAPVEAQRMSVSGSEAWLLLVLIIFYSVGGTNLVFAADSIASYNAVQNRVRVNEIVYEI